MSCRRNHQCVTSGVSRSRDWLEAMCLCACCTAVSLSVHSRARPGSQAEASDPLLIEEWTRPSSPPRYVAPTPRRPAAEQQNRSNRVNRIKVTRLHLAGIGRIASFLHRSLITGSLDHWPVTIGDDQDVVDSGTGSEIAPAPQLTTHVVSLSITVTLGMQSGSGCWSVERGADPHV